jgi:hypothetical protein
MGLKMFEMLDAAVIVAGLLIQNAARVPACLSTSFKVLAQTFQERLSPT